jgi:hypothetical protein
MKEIITREDIDDYKKHGFLTVGDLKKFIDENKLPDNAVVMIQRVEDVYYEKHGWGQYLKAGNGARKYFYSDEYIEETMEKYHPAFSCVQYKDDKDILFIDLHY